MLKIAFLAIFILKLCHAIEVDEDVLAPSISANAGSENDTPTQRWITFTALSVTSTVTSTLKTYTSCYTTANNLATCKTTELSGRRKREVVWDIVDEEPTFVDNDGKVHGIGELVQPSKVVEAADEDEELDDDYEIETTTMQNFEDVTEQISSSGEEDKNEEIKNLLAANGIASYHDIVMKMWEQGDLEPSQRWGFSTITPTTTITTTRTLVQAATQTLHFTSAAANNCFPSSLVVTSLGIAKCA